LGTGDTVDRTSPVMVSMPADVTFVSIHANQFHTCALTSVGTVYCWGDNSYGQLGTGTTVQSNVPTAVAAGVTFVSMSIGARHTCAVTTTGTIYCWGFNYYGQLGIGNAIDSRIPTPVSMPGDVLFASIDAGGNYTCALTTVGTIYCWGRNEYGQLGNGTTSMSTTPSALSLSARVLIDSISVGEISACARTTGAAIYCWGNNIYGQLGDGTTTHSSIPKRLIIPGGETFASITAGVFHTCASTIVDTIYCWGYNAYGQLGTGDTVDRTSPVMVSMSVGVSSPSLSLGSTHTCMRTSTGTIYCWGDNADGQLGNGTTSQSNTPVLVPMPW
jgi:alpha-tubulin suppressor-like RCC1 family protein